MPYVIDTIKVGTIDVTQSITINGQPINGQPINGGGGSDNQEPTNPIIKAYSISKFSINKNNFNQNINSFFNSIENGIFIPYVDGMELPDFGFYAISSVETNLKLVERFANPSTLNQFQKNLFKYDGIDTSLLAGVETYLKFWEATSFSILANNAKLTTNTDFTDKLLTIKNMYSSKRGTIEYFDRINDKGIVEVGTISGKSAIDAVYYVASQVGNLELKNLIYTMEILDLFLDRGIVIIDTDKYSAVTQFMPYTEDYPKGVLIMSAELFLNFLDNEAAVPA
jgi:hypothetical protein